MKLPPLSSKPVFKDVPNNTTMSSIDIPKASVASEYSYQKRATGGPFGVVRKSSSRQELMAELVPAAVIG